MWNKARTVLMTILPVAVSLTVYFSLCLKAYTRSSDRTRRVGVDVGNKFRYSVTVSLHSDNPNASPLPYMIDLGNTEWLEVSVTNISGTNITGIITQHYWNGTEITLDGWVDVATGEGPYQWIDQWLLLRFISANLTAGDTQYNSPSYSTTVINETVPTTYLSGVVRDTNHMNETASYRGTFYDSNTTYSWYWDKLTGVAVDSFVETTYSEFRVGNYTTSTSVEFQIISSDLWVVPEYSTWTPALLMLIVLTSTATVISRQRARATIS